MKRVITLAVLLVLCASVAKATTYAGKLDLNADVQVIGMYDIGNKDMLAGMEKNVWELDKINNGSSMQLFHVGVFQAWNSHADGAAVSGITAGVPISTIASEAQALVNMLPYVTANNSLNLPSWATLIGNYTSINVLGGYTFAGTGSDAVKWRYGVGAEVNIPLSQLQSVLG